ncbi:hypothetical protein QE152_g25018 [Popillia japonica]|uniref:Uncharacterized protein n=1 Tax=Popillia japonica TaxID=7064 RepID=A0AAW1K4M0_POPJA
MTGPALQDELFCILLRFRQSRFVVSADVQKMYRQILVASEQTRLQRVFWRANPKDALRAYELQTVTYGTTAASYLAVKCLQKVAEQNAATYPEASERILRDFYMDDLLIGITSKDISVHKFPTKPELRLLWLKACNLNIQDDVTKYFSLTDLFPMTFEVLNPITKKKRKNVHKTLEPFVEVLNPITKKKRKNVHKTLEPFAKEQAQILPKL